MASRVASSAALAAVVVFSAAAEPQVGQRARVSEEIRVLDTYPFSDPNPIPVLGADRRLYPYHTFEGYSATSRPQEWKVVKMGNDLIELFILPEVGGKVWGAIVKETGQEFIYRNEVMKFRDIALRGPWTSGGIEFNFGVIGHTPATATPVDYTCEENQDGSASCFVGTMDLPSRTHWRVEIKLPADRAYFETHALWYNPTYLEQPYYNWMTAAAFAQNDLEIYVPGDSYLEHSGRERPWPIDEEGRLLTPYPNNAFGGNKSYHVVGELNDFFGGYYHEDGYGWGHWARYEDMPGQKMWLWALSRAGGVWEDLLTDSDGQYIEFQAGRLLVQYAPGEHRNPITQAAFDPLSASRWMESWFPLVGTGGLTDASKEGAMHVRREGSRVRVTVNAFGNVRDTLLLGIGEERNGSGVPDPQPVELSALSPFEATLEVPAGEHFTIRFPALDLEYDSDPSTRVLSRPFEVERGAWASIPEADRHVFQGREFAKGRRYREAQVLFEQALEIEPWNRGSLLGLASLALRSARYERGLEYARRALQLDTYDAEANFLAGNLHAELGNPADARESFGWAARDVGLRAASYIRLADLMVKEGAWREAERYARLAIDFDRYSVPAWQLLAAIGRRAGDSDGATQALTELLEVDPLHHYAFAERYLADSNAENRRELTGAMRSEYPVQTLLELAIGYANRGLDGDAISLLALANEVGGGVLPAVWRAFLEGDPRAIPEPAAADMWLVFPFRPETLPVLRWAAQSSAHWAWDYLLALNLWALNRDEEAAELLAALGDDPDYGPAYAARASLLAQLRGVDSRQDLERAVALAPNNRVLRITLIRTAQENGAWQEAVELSEDALADFPRDFNLELLHVRSLLSLDRYSEAVQMLGETHVLPSENARDSHRLYVLAHMGAALDHLEADNRDRAAQHLDAALLWPELLGQGRPYDPDERLVYYLRGVAAQLEGDLDGAGSAFEAAGLGQSISRVEGRNPASLISPGDGFFAMLEERIVRRAEVLRVEDVRGRRARAEIW